MFGLNDTDKEWKKWGEYDPYFGVATCEKYRGGQNKDDFFASGEQYFKGLVERFDRVSIPLNKDGFALEFGCGVGRILKSMSSYFNTSVGIDISQAMLDEAGKHVDLKKKNVCRLVNQAERLRKNGYRGLIQEFYVHWPTCSL